jgi:SAM-dependent methyltransferase
MHAAAEDLKCRPAGRALDIGCGAARNAVPLARLGWRVVGTDLSWPMVTAAQRRAVDDVPNHRLDVVQAPMTALPVQSGAFDLIVAHGIWNLARSAAEFRSGVAEAARAAAPGALLFVFTFSRNTLPPEAEPVAGESFVFTQFSGGGTRGRRVRARSRGAARRAQPAEARHAQRRRARHLRRRIPCRRFRPLRPCCSPN